MTLSKLRNRLSNIGITITLTANYPWVYLNDVNGNKVTERYKANHGYTAFMLQNDGTYAMTNRRHLFKTIRRHLVK